jgi:deoxyuridine 5'-triphosphate nucleotidohydrolase
MDLQYLLGFLYGSQSLKFTDPEKALFRVHKKSCKYIEKLLTQNKIQFTKKSNKFFKYISIETDIWKSFDLKLEDITIKGVFESRYRCTNSSGYLRSVNISLEQVIQYYQEPYDKIGLHFVKRTLNNKILKYKLNLEESVAPFKTRDSDSGYDLTLVKKIKVSEYGVEYYDTGVSFQCPNNHYLDLVPRSSILKSGYMLANSVGIIDHEYRGNVIVALVKLNPNVPDLVLPNRLVQVIPRQYSHMVTLSCQELQETERNDKGFGSSGNVKPNSETGDVVIV